MVVAGAAARMRADHGREMPRAAVGQVVAVDRGDDDVVEAQLGHRIGDAGRLVRIERARHAGRDVAEGAGPRAGVAHDHHGGVLAASSTRRCSGRRPPRRP